MDFQPRLGVVTRSLWLAGPDLIHFAIVAGALAGGPLVGCVVHAPQAPCQNCMQQQLQHLLAPPNPFLTDPATQLSTHPP